MMPNTFGPVRVSILERIVPSLAFIVAAVSGAVGGAMLIRFFSLLSQAELAGYAAFFGGVAEIELAVGGVLILAVALCAIGIVVSIIRLFTTNTTASPPGLLFLMLGLLSLVPPFAIHYVLHTMKEVVTSPDPAGGGVSSVAGSITTAAYFAIGGPVVHVGGPDDERDASDHTRAGHGQRIDHSVFEGIVAPLDRGILGDVENGVVGVLAEETKGGAGGRNRRVVVIDRDQYMCHTLGCTRRGGVVNRGNS